MREAKEEEEKRKKELAKEKRIKRMLEAAFDGDYDEIQAIVKEVVKKLQKFCVVKGFVI